MRTTQQVFDDHWKSILAGDMGVVLADYATDAVFIRAGSVAHGHAEIRAVFDAIGADLADHAFAQESVTVEGPMVLFEWSARAESGTGARGADTFYIHDDRIRYQTLTYQKSET